MALKIALVGAGGRMGRALITEIAQNEAFVLASALESETSPLLGAPVFADQTPPLLFSSSLPEALAYCDVVIDFSTPSSIHALLPFLEHSSKPCVCGVTNLPEEGLAAFKALAKKIPFFYAPNMNPLVALLKREVCLLAKILGDEFDIEISETHHRGKADAPSGTALSLGKAIAEAQGKDFDPCACFSRTGTVGARTKGSIGFSVIRGGQVPGQHTVHFLGDAEHVSLTHESFSRQVFAKGALGAAQWLVSQASGRLYGMEDWLETLAK
ncbi:4-hydroxy-tetrahydrodipicolinate reductase [Alphaproteobacteria bacterium]|nr:4-hydroxy-tetrahydrodipicolinate reductase [Alphaproteobacteria bacterium]GHS96024.1 4-hydroxy-tetrahydrodipicolinate reductase [Alphaproteobacteria bacterium]